MQRRNAAAYRHVFHAIFHIVRNDGIAALWTGTMPAAVRASLLTSSQLATYDQGKALIKHCTGLHEGLSAHVGAAMTAGLVTTTVSTPADVVKSVVMSSNPRLRPVECINLILTRDGLSGFLRGWTANYARLGPHTLITVVAYENLRTACGWKNL